MASPKHIPHGGDYCGIFRTSVTLDPTSVTLDPMLQPVAGAEELPGY